MEVASEGRMGRVIAWSSPMRELLARVRAIGGDTEPLLIRGERGAGKEVLARAIHEHGPRAGALVVLDGHGLTADGFRSELLGAVDEGDEEPGALERARGGTLLIDEIAAMSPDVQDALLAILDDETAGSLDVRFVATTSERLEERTASGAFRARLMEIFGAAELTVPPLRHRAADIRPIALSMLAEIGALDPSRIAALDRALAIRERHDWPGNGRELWAFVRRVALLGDVGSISAPHTGTRTAEPRTLRVEWRTRRDLVGSPFSGAGSALRGVRTGRSYALASHFESEE